jgi:hypothetical protein
VSVRTYSDLVLALSPALYWRLGESAGTTAADASGNGRTGTYTGTFTLAQTGALASDADKAVLLSGGSGRVASTYQLFVTGGKFTVALWAKASSAPNDGTIAIFGGASVGTEIYCRTNPATGDVTFTPNRTAANPAATWAAAISGATSYHFIVLTFNDTTDTAELYVDGVSKGTRSVTAGLSGKSFLAGYDSVGSTYPGTLDEVSAWNGTVLSAQNVLDLYNAGAFGPFTDFADSGTATLTESGAGTEGLSFADSGSAALALSGSGAESYTVPTFDFEPPVDLRALDSDLLALAVPSAIDLARRDDLVALRAVG